MAKACAFFCEIIRECYAAPKYKSACLALVNLAAPKYNYKPISAGPRLAMASKLEAGVLCHVCFLLFPCSFIQLKIK